MEPLSANDPQVVGEFQVRARLGAGGMGRVYLAYSRAGRAVAVKVIHPQLAQDPEFRQRFGREVVAARAVSGMYTAPVVAAGVNDDPPWLATAYVPGPSLSNVVTRHGALPAAATWRLAAGLAEALGAVHACGIVHRDLKPANVLLAAEGPIVIDFGISKALDGPSVTATGMAVGTPGYMSPEQAEGAQPGPAGDVFSLGCLLAYAATGNAPFGTGSAASVLYRVVNAQPDLTGVPDRLRYVITACLAKDPAQRPGLDALAAMIAQAGPAITATPTSFWPAPVAELIRAAEAIPMQVSQVAAAPPAHAGPLQDGYLAAATASMAAGAPAPTWGMTRPLQPGGSSWPQGSPGSWPAPSGTDPMAQYRPAPPRPRPPTPVLAAGWLMYSGAAISLLHMFVILATIGKVTTAFKRSHPLVSASTARSIAAVSGLEVVVVGTVVIGLWLWLAYESKRGHGWVRTVGTVLFGVATFLGSVVLRIPGNSGVDAIGAVIWLIGLATVILLWQRTSSDFFAIHR